MFFCWSVPDSAPHYIISSLAASHPTVTIVSQINRRLVDGFVLAVPITHSPVYINVLTFAEFLSWGVLQLREKKEMQ